LLFGLLFGSFFGLLFSSFGSVVSLPLLRRFACVLFGCSSGTWWWRFGGVSRGHQLLEGNEKETKTML
jgi:hypothetical protein